MFLICTPRKTWLKSQLIPFIPVRGKPRRDAQMERVHVRGDAHRKKTVGIYQMDGKYGIELGKSN